MWSNHYTIGQTLSYRSRFKYIIYVYYIHSTRIHYHWLLLFYRIVQKMKSTNKYLNVKSQVVLFLLFRNIFFSIYIKKSLKKITDNHFFPFTETPHRPNYFLTVSIFISLRTKLY